MAANVQHVRVCVPEPVCKGCLHRWPCPYTRLAESGLDGPNPRPLTQAQP